MHPTVRYDEATDTFTVKPLLTDERVRTDVTLAIVYDPDDKPIATFRGDHAYDHAQRFFALECGPFCSIDLFPKTAN